MKELAKLNLNLSKKETMYTTTINTLKPEAYITVKKNRLKLYEEKNHYLKNKSTFEIELFNPTSEKVLAKVWINDKLISAGGIILNPGQRVYLERFIDVAKKFQFDVYEVDDVKETEAARERNGLVKVSFFSEYMPSTWLTTSSGNTTITNYPSSTTYTYNASNAINSSNSTFTTTGLNVSFTGPNIRSSKVLTKSSVDSVETGRVAEGEKSNQQFQAASGKFSDWAFHTYEYHLLPESLKAVTASDIRQYCDECGIRIRKSSWKYCPNCGAHL